MPHRLKSVMLIDDNKYDNYYHEKVIRNSHVADTVILMHSAAEALRFLSEKSPDELNCIDLIFVELNMNGMTGWEFLEQYHDRFKKQCNTRLMVLTGSDNPDDMKRTRYNPVLKGFIVKPLTRDIMTHIASETN